MLPQAPTTLVILLGLSAMLLVYLSAWAQFHSGVGSAREFSFLLLSAALYSLGYAVELSRADLRGVLEAIRLEYMGLAFVPAFFLLFAIRFTRNTPTPPGLIAGLLAMPVITVVLVFTQEHHQLYYIHPRVTMTGFYPALSFERGIGYVLTMFYALVCEFSGLVLLIVHAFRVSPRYRLQAQTIALGALFPVASSVFYFLDFIPFHIDPIPFALSLAGVLFAFALFKLKLFELVPAARELAIDAVRDAFLVVDAFGQVQDFNRAITALPGAEALKIGEPLPMDNPLVKKLWPLLHEGQDELEFFIEQSSGEERYYRAKAYPIYGKRSQYNGQAVLISDVTETVGLLHQLSYQANVDELTGLLNRRHLMKMGARELEASHRSGLPLGVILIDLDHFKSVNDTCGHAAGDEVLRSVAECFRRGVRSVDLLGRYGGEEFAVFLPGADLEATVRVAERLRESLASWSVLKQDENLRITASFGVYAANSDLTIDQLLSIADQALYRAKQEGRNRVVSA
ncbi:MAG TPA: GGDEF domain-containing protein [Anaerolinea thermolimosa]|uniref:GGDEF domain-containing protein n=1 Tax=Anaerolinea thermolimosa TaxID=229919 RepID=A0A3D1JFW2_9CHLR|nr:diguanylate cyclase [Anaerolinea thermolimosa]GAP08054.1 protein containing diguanylate cyclase (GGDEF) domain [Anaerolinea thermolimosa]HCE17117.1 GGDEF domain-containing protein [Anaerolinea thermolimosa]